MAKIIKIEESDMNSGHVMEKTEGVKVSSDTMITVPEGYSAVIFSGEKKLGECQTCEKKRLKKIIGSDVVGRIISVLYVNDRKLTEMSWGVGNIPITYTPNGRSIEVQVGASGIFLAKITDPVAFYNEYSSDELGIMTLPEVTGHITSGFRIYAKEIVTEIFNEALEPIIDTAFVLDEADLRFEERICGRKLSKVPGVVFQKAKVNSITVREDDIDALREFYKGKKRKK